MNGDRPDLTRIPAAPILLSGSPSALKETPSLFLFAPSWHCSAALLGQAVCRLAGGPKQPRRGRVIAW